MKRVAQILSVFHPDWSVKSVESALHPIAESLFCPVGALRDLKLSHNYQKIFLALRPDFEL